MKRAVIILTIMVATCLGTVFGQTNIFVSSNGSDSNSGATWTTAKGTLAGALQGASNGTHIYMMTGTYTCYNVVIPNGVTVTGGYAQTSTGTDLSQRNYPGSNDNWDSPTWCTILNGADSTRVITVNSGGTIEGCVLTHGKVTNKGGGVLIDGGTVTHCVLINNVALDYDNQNAKGGGAYIQNNGFLLNSVVAKNIANNGPGVAGTDGTLTNNTITANVARANCGTVTDDDGNVYTTIMIGSQCWMAENLRVTRPASGQLIPYAGGPSTVSQTSPYRYYPNGDYQNIASYGYLYNFPAVLSGETSSSSNPSGVRGICPFGWHVPSAAEWTQLTDFVMSQIPYRCVNNGTSYITKALSSTSGWSNDNNTCTPGYNQMNNNTTGFNAMPAGYSHPSSSYGYAGYDYFRQGAYYWCSDKKYFAIQGISVNFSGTVDAKSTYAVRCLRD